MKRRSYLALAGVTALAGCIGGDDDDTAETGGGGLPESSPLRDDPIDADPGDLLPDLDDFDDGWREQDREEAMIVLANATEASSVEFTVEMGETIDDGEQLFEERFTQDQQEHELETLDFGAQAYSFQPGRGEWTVVVRVANVVGTMVYDPGPGVDDPEQRRMELAELFVDSLDI